MITSKQQSRDELIEDIKQRVVDKILEPSNAELLKKLIIKSDSLDEAISIAELGTTYRKTGFHFDKRLEKTSNDINYLCKNNDLSFFQDKDAITHKLIIGDNYPALLNLLIQYKNSIDIIYIDPPYGKDSMGEFAKTNYDNAITRDNLLSMLYPRLVLAKQLLTDSGIIFCSIDDKNQAYVRGLFDSVFEEKNFVANCPRKSVSIVRTNSDHELQVLNDYILIYAKEKNNLHLNKRITGEKKYPYEDEKGRYSLKPLQNSGPQGTRDARPNLYYPIYQLDTGELSLQNSFGAKEFLPKKQGIKDGRWIWSKKFFEENKDKLIIYNDKPQIKNYLDESEDQTKRQAFTNWLEFPNADGSKMLTEIGLRGLVEYPKPVDLIKWCINLAKQESDAIILDFFAGSGTTGQAVLELNKKDGGARQFILVQNNEKTDTTPNGIALDVTTKRLKRVMTGQCYDGSSDFPWAEKHEPFKDNLLVMDVKTVFNAEASQDKTPFDVIDEKLYGKTDLSVADKVQWVCDNFENTQTNYESDSEYKKRIGDK